MSSYTNATNVGILLGTTFSTATQTPVTNPTAANVNLMVTFVQQFIDIKTGRTWTSATFSEYFDTFSDTRRSLSHIAAPNEVQYTFFLTKKPLVSVESVRENTSALVGTNWVTRASGYGGDYLVYFKEGSVKFHRTFPFSGRRNIYIAYTYGEGAGVPNDIQYAATLLTAVQVIDMIKRATDQQGIEDVSVGAAHYNLSDLEKQRSRYEATADMILEHRGYSFNALTQ